MICPKCRTQNPDNQQYCINCGYKLFEVKNVLGKVCPQCGRINPIDQKRCINCHADLTKIAGHTVQRQVSTIYQPKRRKWLTIVGAALGILMIVLGTYQGLKHYGIAVQTVETLEVQRYDQHHRRVKTFYIATKVSSAYYKRVGNHYYYHGVTCHTYNEANRLSGRQLETIYRREPARRLHHAYPR